LPNKDSPNVHKYSNIFPCLSANVHNGVTEVMYDVITGKVVKFCYYEEGL